MTFEPSPEPERVEVVFAELPALVLRDFTWRLRPQYEAGGAVRGIALDVISKVGLPLQITYLYERAEFVSMAHQGLLGLDAADAAASSSGNAGDDAGRENEGGENDGND